MPIICFFLTHRTCYTVHMFGAAALRMAPPMRRLARRAQSVCERGELVLEQIILQMQGGGKNRALECIFIRRKAIIFIDGCLLFPVLAETISACYFSGEGRQSKH